MKHLLAALMLPAAAFAADAAHSPSPVPELLTQARADCDKIDHGQMKILPAFIMRPDLNADGTPDVVVDYRAITCTTAPTLWATPAGARLVLFASTAQGWQKVADTTVQSWQTTNRNGQTQLKLMLQPAAAGAIPQATYLYVQNGKFVTEKAQ